MCTTDGICTVTVMSPSVDTARPAIISSLNSVVDNGCADWLPVKPTGAPFSDRFCPSTCWQSVGMRTDQLRAAVAPSEIVLGVAVKLVMVRVRQSITFGSGDPPSPPPIGAAYADATQKLDRIAARINLAPARRKSMCVLVSFVEPYPAHVFCGCL